MLQNPLFVLNKKHYLLAIIIIAPLLNFLFGISVDLYTPSLVNIAEYFHASEIAEKRTISALMLGYCFGCIVVGPLMDDYGRRKIILWSLLAFICISLLATVVSKIAELSLCRVLQGFAIAGASIGSRILIFDNFTGKRYAIAILYTSFAYAIGPVIGPFIGGWLQYLFGWKSVFIVYALLGSLILLLFFCFVSDAKYEKKVFSLKAIVKEYLDISSDKIFLSGGIILGLTLFELLSFPVLSPYFFHFDFHLGSVALGDSAVLLGGSYLLGTLINRFFIPIFNQKKLATFGFYLLFLSVINYAFIAFTMPISKWAFILPSVPIVFSAGFIFPNVLGASLQIYPKNVGVAAAVQSLLFMLVSMLVMSIVNHLNMHQLTSIAILYICISTIKGYVFFRYFIHTYSKES